MKAPTERRATEIDDPLRTGTPLTVLSRIGDGGTLSADAHIGVGRRPRKALRVQNYQCHVSINNRCSEHLRLLKQDLPWGTMREGPVDDIPPKVEVKAFVATGSVGPAGTEGTVVYQIGDDANTTITIAFDVPTNPLASNSVTATTSHPDVAAQIDGLLGSGSTESVTIKVIDGR